MGVGTGQGTAASSLGGISCGTSPYCTLTADVAKTVKAYFGRND